MTNDKEEEAGGVVKSAERKIGSCCMHRYVWSACLDICRTFFFKNPSDGTVKSFREFRGKRRARALFTFVQNGTKKTTMP